MAKLLKIGEAATKVADIKIDGVEAETVSGEVDNSGNWTSITIGDTTANIPAGGGGAEVVAIDAGTIGGPESLVSPWKQYGKELDADQGAAIDAALVAGNRIKFTGTFSDESGSGGAFEDDPVSFEITTDLAGVANQEGENFCRSVGFIAWQFGMIHLYLFKGDSLSNYILKANVVKLSE